MHEPVLLQQVVELLRPNRKDGVVVDATVGLGGHAEALLARNATIRLIGIDRDPRALQLSRERLRKFGDRVALVEGRHEKLIDILKQSQAGAISGLAISGDHTTDGLRAADIPLVPAGSSTAVCVAAPEAGPWCGPCDPTPRTTSS